jgi:hypothetical protein
MPLIKNDLNNQSDEESDEENIEVKSENDGDIAVDKQQKSTYKTIKSACGSNIIIKKKNNRSKRPPIVIFEEDLYGETEPQKIIVKKKPTKGRPKKPKPVVEYINDKGETVDNDDINTEQVIINKPQKQKLSAKDLKLIELQEKILQLETVSGKKIRGTKKGTVDKRQTKAPTEKQIQARKKFVENNRLRREAKKKEKEEQDKVNKKENVKVVIDELQEIKKKSLEEKQKQELLKEQMKQELLLEQKAKQEQAKPKNNYDDFM